MILQLFVQRPLSKQTSSVSKGLLQFFNKFSLVDAYFFYQNQPMLVSKFGIEWFNDPDNWNYFQASHFLLFYCVSFTPEIAKFQFFYKTQSFANHELVHLPLNNLSVDVVYADNAAQTRTANNTEVHVFAIGGTIISKVYDGIRPDAYANAIPVTVVNPLGNINQPFIKTQPTKQPYYVPNAQNSYRLRNINSNNPRLRFSQLLIYPLGFVEHIIIKSLNPSLNYISNNLQVYVLNDYVYFQIELPRCYQLTFNDTFLEIYVEPKTTGIDIMYFTNKPIMGNECLVGQQLNKITHSGFYRSIVPSPGYLKFVLPQGASNYNSIGSPVQVNTGFSPTSDAAIVLFTGDNRLRGDKVNPESATFFPNVYTFDSSSWYNWLFSSGSEPTVIQYNLTESAELSSDATVAEAYTVSVPRRFAKTWQSHITSGNVLKLPDLYLLNITSDDSHCGTSGANNFWTQIDVHIKTLLMAAKKILAINKKPHLILWYHDELLSRNKFYSQTLDSAFSIQFDQFFRKLFLLTDTGEVSLTKFPYDCDLNTVQRDAINAQMISLSTTAPRYDLVDFRASPGFSNSVPGNNIIDSTSLLYNVQTVDWMVSNFYNAAITSVGDTVYDATGLVTPFNQDYLISEDEVELVCFVGDEFYNGNTTVTSNYTPHTSVYSWLWNDSVMNFPYNSTAQFVPTEFTDIYQWHNVGIGAKQYINPTITPNPVSTVYCTSPIVSFAQSWKARFLANDTNKRMYILQFCFPGQQMSAEFDGANYYSIEALANPVNSDKNLAERFFFAMQKIKEYFQTQKRTVVLRALFYSDYYSWTKELVLNFFSSSVSLNALASLTKYRIDPGFNYDLFLNQLKNRLAVTANIPFIPYVNQDPLMSIAGYPTVDFAKYSTFWEDSYRQFFATGLFMSSTLFTPIRSGTFYQFFNLFDTTTGYVPLIIACDYFANTYVNALVIDGSAPIIPSALVFGIQTTGNQIINVVSPGIANQLVQDKVMQYMEVTDNSRCYFLEKIDYTLDTVNTNLNNPIEIPSAALGPNDIPILIHLTNGQNVAADMTPTVEGPLTKVEGIDNSNITYNIVPSTINWIPLTNNHPIHNIGPTFGISPFPRINMLSWEYAKLWEEAAIANPALPKLRVVLFCTGFFSVTGWLNNPGSNYQYVDGQPTGVISIWLQGMLTAILGQPPSGKTYRPLGVIVEYSMTSGSQTQRRSDIFGPWLYRLDEWLRKFFNDNMVQILYPKFAKASAGYINTAAERQQFEYEIRQVESTFASHRRNIFLVDAKNLYQFTEYYADNGVYSSFFKLRYNTSASREIAKIWLSNPYYGPPFGSNTNNYGNLKLIGAPYTRVASFFRYDMNDVNSGKNLPSLIITWNAHGQYKYFNKSQIVGDYIQFFDNIYIEWAVEDIDNNFPIYTPAKSISPILCAFGNKTSNYRITASPTTSHYETNATQLITATENNTYFSRTHTNLIAYMYNFSNLTHITFSALDNIPFNTLNDYVDNINRKLATQISTSTDNYSFQYLMENNALQVIYKTYEEAFSKTLYYQLKHVDFVQIEIALDRANIVQTTINNNILVNELQPKDLGIKSSILPHYEYGALYCYTSNNEMCQVVAYSSLFRQYRSTLLPSCIVNENGQVYCRYYPIQNLRHFQVFLQFSSTNGVVSFANYLQNLRLFLFLN